MPAVVVPVATWIAGAVSTGLAAIGIGGVAGGWLTVAAYTVSEIALYAGMSYAVDAASRPKLKPAGTEILFNMDPAFPREMIIGQRLVGGSMVARYSRGSNLYNAHLVIQVADHPCVELSKVYDGGRVVQDTPLSHGVRTEITAYSNSGGARVWMTWHDGRPGQTADSDLVTKSAQDPEVVAGKIPAWTNDHVGAGCAYIHVEVQWDSDILTSIPQFTWLVKGAKLYDRRKDTTAGGSGSHRLDDPSTWEYSTNAAVAADHFLLGYKVEDEDLAFGIGLHPSEVPYEIFANQADLADEDVETGTGDDVETIKRYAANGVISTADYFEEVLEAFQVQMAARFVDLGGRIGILGAEEREISLDLSDMDLTAEDQMQFADKLPFSDLYGSVAGTYADPANLYQQTPYTTQTTAYNALPDGGEAQQAQLPLPFEIHPRRADRLASAWINRESLQPRLVGVFMARAWRLEPGDWFTFSSERLALTEAKFEVIDIAKHDDFTVTITARAIDPDFLAFSVDDDPEIRVPPEVDPIELFLDEPTFDVEVTTLEAGGVIEPAIEFTLTSDETVAREIVIEYGVWDGSDVEGPTLVDSIHASQVVSKIRKGILPDTDYVFRCKAKAGIRESDWTDWSSPVTTGATYAVGSAASVPWSGVTGSGKPADNATVGARAGTNLYRSDGTTVLSQAEVRTAEGTAAAITGQGWGATAAQAAADNNYTQTPAANSARYSMLEGGGVVGWAVHSASFGGSPALSRKTSGVSSSTKPGLTLDNASANSGQVYYASFGSAYSGETGKNGLPVKSGERVQVAARVLELTGGCTGVIIRANLFALDGTNIGELAPTNGLATVNNLTGTGRVGCFATASQDGFIVIRLYAKKDSATTTAGGVTVDEMFISKARAGQVELDPYTPGPGVEFAANVTETRVAASITSQGAFATLNSAAYGSGLLTGFGTLAPLGYVTLNSNVRREDGSTALTDALAVTSLGTAAAIASQGALATLNAVGAAQVTDGAISYLKLAATAVRLGVNITRNDGSTSLTDALAVTSLGTAAAITSQGALATLSAVGSSQITNGAVDYLKLATTAVRLNTNIVREDGSTAVTDALVVTSVGTAAAISGQGALATLSSLAYGGAYLTGFAALAAKATIDSSALVGAGVIVYTALASTAVRLGTNIVRNDGSTSLTDALAVTSLGTAAAIASQGALATLNSLAYGGGYLTGFGVVATLSVVTGTYLGAGAGANQLYDARFRNVSTYWGVSENITGSIASQGAFTTTDGERGYLITCTGATTAGQVVDMVGSAANRLPCIEGDKIEGQALIAGANFSNCRLIVTFRNAAGGTVSSTTLSDLPRTLDGTGALATLHQCFGIATAPAGTATVELLMRARCDGTAAPVVRFVRPMLRVAHAGQTERTPWHVGFDGVAGADPTASNTAAAISGQGSLATLGFVTFGTNVRRSDGSTSATDADYRTSLGVAASITSQGGLATLSFVTINTNLRLADGTTVATTAMVVTASGTAAAIAGQGSLATLNDAGVFGYATPTSGNLTNSYVSKASKSVTTDGGPVEIELSAFFQRDNPLLEIDATTEVTILCKIKRDSTELVADLAICGWVYLAMSGAGWMTAPVQHGRVLWVDSPSAGTYTYSIELKCSVDDDGVAPPASMLSGGKVFRIFNPQGGANAVSGP